MAKTTRRRIFARVAQSNVHTANGIDGYALTLAKSSKKFIHSSLLGRQLLLIRPVERRASTASFHDGTRRLGINGLMSGPGRLIMRALGTSLRRLILAPTKAGALGLSLAFGWPALRILRRLGFLGRFFLLRPLSRLDQSTTSLTLRTRFCHEVTPLIYKLKSESIVPCQASRRYTSVHFTLVISPTTFARRGRGAARN